MDALQKIGKYGQLGTAAFTILAPVSSPLTPWIGGTFAALELGSSRLKRKYGDLDAFDQAVAPSIANAFVKPFAELGKKGEATTDLITGPIADLVLPKGPCD